NLNGEVETAYDALKLFITLTTKRISDNKKEIMVQMESLVNKGIINVKDNNGALTITFNEINGGFEQVLFDHYKAMKDTRQYYMFCAVKKWERETTGAIYAIWQWGKLLSLKSDRRVKDILNEACDEENGFLIKRVGAYSRDKKVIGSDGQVYQDANNYFPNYDWFKSGKISIAS